MPDEIFKTGFEALTDYKPFPWQINLFEKWFVKGKFPSSCDLPTGLGKTSVIAVWLIALIEQPDKMPRRLVYVVNRRTVVDQTTDEVEKLRKNIQRAGFLEILRQRCSIPLKNGESPLGISTLRGQFADNREWSADPSRPAVICGTVDMIGSRLLFNGYQVGFKTKPLHAGFLGQDVLLVHDEAHLEPAFQELLNSIQKEQKRCKEFGAFRVMKLSATSRQNGAEGDETRLELTDAEKNPPHVIPDPPTEPIHHVWRRQNAKKAFHLHENQDDKESADQISGLALKHKDSGRAVLVFVRMVEDVEKILKKLPKESTERLTGTLRGLERDGLVKKPMFQRFLPESNRDKNVAPADGTAYLVCTSAGEVGVNISADHMVCDLSTFESMTQRFGRVNRFGDREDTRIDIVYPKEFGTKDKSGRLKVDDLDRGRQKTLELLTQLNGDASPAALGKLDPAARLAAFAPPPTILAATDILFDAWALTTIREKLPGRPPVEPYLHGVAEWELPQTYVAWREEVEVITDDLLERFKPEDLLEDYPLKPHELLRDRSDRVFKHLQSLAKKYPDAPVWIVDIRDRVDVTTLDDLTKGDKNAINHVTVLLPPYIGGLTRTGMLDGAAVGNKPDAGEAAKADQTADPDRGVRHDVADAWYENKEQTLKRRVRVWDDSPVPDGMRWVRTIDTKPYADEDEADESTGRRFWLWYELPKSADGDGSKSSTKPVLWQVHTDDVVKNATVIVERLPLPHEIKQAIILAAKWHDLGKRRSLFQRILGNFNSQILLSKSGKKKGHIPEQYRHEFGSLLDVLHGGNGSPPPKEFADLSEEMKDLVLHLIAAHHGRARPHFPSDEAFDPERDGHDAATLTIEAPRRFARLQRKYGRWGLAYLESLLRAADYAASARPSGFVETAMKQIEEAQR